jgi:hypothetical protein
MLSSAMTTEMGSLTVMPSFLDRQSTHPMSHPEAADLDWEKLFTDLLRPARVTGFWIAPEYRDN